MHVFQPFKATKMEMNPYSIAGEAGVCVTVEVDGKVNTNSSTYVTFGKLWGKEMIFVFLREQSYTKELIDKSDFFSVTFFEDKYKTSLKFLKSISGRDEDKIKEIGMHVNKKIDIPYIDEGNLVFLCDKVASIPIDDSLKDDAFISPQVKNKHYPEGNCHYVIMGEILETMAR